MEDLDHVRDRLGGEEHGAEDGCFGLEVLRRDVLRAQARDIVNRARHCDPLPDDRTTAVRRA
jgi:hypothetical protein